LPEHVLEGQTTQLKMLFSFFLFSSANATFVRMNNGFATRSVLVNLKGSPDVTVSPSVSDKSFPSLYDLAKHMLDGKSEVAQYNCDPIMANIITRIFTRATRCFLIVYRLFQPPVNDE